MAQRAELTAYLIALRMVAARVSCCVAPALTVATSGNTAWLSLSRSLSRIGH